MRVTSRASALIGGALGTMLLAGPAWAHHAMGGEVPGTFAEGLLSGLAHPVIGLDHLAFILAVGLIAASLGAGLQIAGTVRDRLHARRGRSRRRFRLAAG